MNNCNGGCNMIFNILGGVINMEAGKKETNISIGTNNGTVNNAEGNIQSINNVNQADNQQISTLIQSLIDLMNNQDIETEVKEDIIDDLEIIEEQINSETPKYSRLKKAYQGVCGFIAKIPSGLAHATLILTQMNELTEKLKPIIEKVT